MSVHSPHRTARTNITKALVCIAQSGAVIFVSRLFTGCTSDPELTRRSGFLEKLEPGDQVMVDRGFTSP